MGWMSNELKLKLCVIGITMVADVMLADNVAKGKHWSNRSVQYSGTVRIAQSRWTTYCHIPGG